MQDTTNVHSATGSQAGQVVAYVTVSKSIAEHQDSRVSENFDLNYPGTVQWRIQLQPPGVGNVYFTVMHDKKNANDQPRLPNVCDGSQTVGQMDGSSDGRLYIGRLNMLAWNEFEKDKTNPTYHDTDVFGPLGVDSFVIEAVAVD